MERLKKISPNEYTGRAKGRDRLKMRLNEEVEELVWRKGKRGLSFQKREKGDWKLIEYKKR